MQGSNTKITFLRFLYLLVGTYAVLAFPFLIVYGLAHGGWEQKILLYLNVLTFAAILHWITSGRKSRHIRHWLLAMGVANTFGPLVVEPLFYTPALVAFILVHWLSWAYMHINQRKTDHSRREVEL